MYNELLDDLEGPLQLQNSSNSDCIAETHIIVLPFKPFLSLNFSLKFYLLMTVFSWAPKPEILVPS